MRLDLMRSVSKDQWCTRLLSLAGGLGIAVAPHWVTAQNISPPPASATPAFTTADADATRAAAPPSRWYGGIEYLHWWVKGAPLSVPLVSTGPISTTHHGWLSSPDSTILYGSPGKPAQGGNDTQPFPGFSGGRLTLGYGLDDSQRYAVEASGFGLESQSAGFEIRGNQNGLPIINIPVFNTTPYTPGGRPGGLPPAEDGLPAALPSDPDRFDTNAGAFTGRVKVTNSLQLWGADLAGECRSVRCL